MHGVDGEHRALQMYPGLVADLCRTAQPWLRPVSRGHGYAPCHGAPRCRSAPRWSWGSTAPLTSYVWDPSIFLLSNPHCL